MILYKGTAIMMRHAETRLVLLGAAATTLMLLVTPPSRGDIDNPREYAASRVLKIEAGKKSQGSAVLVEFDQDNRIGYFVTCYHVLSGTAGFAIYTWDG